MADPWAEFKEAPASGATDPWAEFKAADAGPAPAAAPQEGGLFRNVAAGAVGALTGAGAQAANFLGPGALLDAMGGPGTTQHLMNQGLGIVGFNPENIPAPTFPERLARGIGGGIASMAIPGAGTGSVLRNLAVGTASGAGAATGEELAPGSLKPLAGLIGGLAGGSGAAMARLPRAGGVSARLSDAGARSLARQILESNASDIGQVRTSLATGIPGAEIVPGSQPTTFQMTGDLGLGGLERQYDTQGKAPPEGTPKPFAQRREEQNAARRAALQTIQSGGNPADVATYFRQQLDDLDRQTAADAHAMLLQAQAKADALGGAKTPEAHGEAIRDVALAADKASKVREQSLWNAVDPSKSLTGNMNGTVAAAREIEAAMPRMAKPMGGEEASIFEDAKSFQTIDKVSELVALRSRVSTELRNQIGPEGTPQAYARLTQLRNAIQDNLEKTIFDAYAPSEISARSGDAASLLRDVPKEDVTQAARDIFTANSPKPRSQTIIDEIRGIGGIRTVDPRGKLTPEGQEISNILRRTAPVGTINNKTGMTADYVREYLQEHGWLTDRASRGADLQDLYDALAEHASGNKVYHPEDDVGVRIQARNDLEDELSRAGVSAKDPREVQIAKLANYRHTQGGEQEIPGWEKSGELPLTGGAGTATIPSVAPTADVGLPARAAAATAFTKEAKRTFERGPVGKALARADMSDLFKLHEARVPEKFFHPGPTGFRDMQALYKAVGENRAVPLVADYAASSLRKFAADADGVISEPKFLRWRDRHSESLRALPPEVQAKFADAATAGKTLADANRARAASMDAMQKSALGKVMGDVRRPVEAGDVTRTIGGIFNTKDAIATMREIATAARKEPFAEQGLRQSVADYIVGRFIANTEAGTSGLGQIRGDQFQTFLRNNRPVLRQVFDGHEIDTMDRIAADIQRANRSLASTGIPGRSTTAQDLYETGRGPQLSRFMWFKDLLAAKLGYYIGGPWASVAGAIGEHTIQSMRNAGITRSEQIVTKALLDPVFARELLKPMSRASSADKTFARAIQRAFVPSAVATMASQGR